MKMRTIRQLLLPLMQSRHFCAVAAAIAVTVAASTGCAKRQEVTQVQLSAWAGESSSGYVRVELWVDESLPRNSPSELRILHSDGSVFRHRGQLINIPNDVAPTRAPWRAFIRIPEEHAVSFELIPAFLASVNPEGVMRLYAFSALDGTGACNLQPSH